MEYKKNKKKLYAAREVAHRGVDSIANKVEIVNEQSRRQVDRLKKKALLLKKDVDSFVQKHPEKSVLVAAGIGTIIGAILARVMLKKKH